MSIWYFVVNYLYVSFNELIPAVGNQRAIFAAIDCSYLCSFGSKMFSVPPVA